MIYPPWFAWLHARIGLKEFAGAPDNPAVTELWTLAMVPVVPAFSQDETPWCAAAVGAAFEQSGYRGTRSGMARSYADNWPGSVRLTGPALGAACVIERNPKNPPFAHVGLLAGCDPYKVALLGGNQADSVNISSFDRGRVVGYFWPGPEVMLRPEWVNPRLPTAQVGGSVV